MKHTKKLTTCGLLIAAATVLAWISKLIPSPWLQGGSVTLASSVPIIVISMMFGTKWGITASFVYALIQMMTGFYPPPTQNFTDYILVVLLDYILAFGMYGLAGLFCKKEKAASIPFAGGVVMCLRYVCHVLSGMIIWGVYAENQSVFAYAVIYNGTYMLPETIITVLTLVIIRNFISEKLYAAR